MSVQEILIPDIGGSDDVEVIEVLVAVGDAVALEDPLVTLESDKASMDVPSPAAGVVKELKISVGDTVSEGSAVLLLEVEEEAANVDAAPTQAAPTPAEAPVIITVLPEKSD